MKNMKKRIAAMLLALACLPVTGIRAQAIALESGVNWDYFANLEIVDDRGMIAYSEDNIIYCDDRNTLYQVSPRKNFIQLVLRENVDPDAALAEIAEVADEWIPGIKDGFSDNGLVRQYAVTAEDGQTVLAQIYKYTHESIPDDDPFARTIQIFAREEYCTKELESNLLLALARRHLISEFYGWGETADFQEGHFTDGVLNYSDSGVNIMLGTLAEDRTWEESDWDAVQAYLDAHYPGAILETYLDHVSRSLRQGDDGFTLVETPVYYHRVVPAEELSFREKAELAAELWENCRLGCMVEYLQDATPPATGRNALESPGDVTLDCELSLLDAIALNKNLLGMESLCDTALKNADADGNGTADASDSLAILRELVGLTEGFQEK
ncbi:MAG: dockerin type I repeat-containing protein [Oscillospiraceae bacterium]|nr:dockerin type I repeat-containing protein [Oscillospiraceae bacterium]